MPELPEVETIVRDLAQLLLEARIQSVEVFRPDLIEGESPESFASALEGETIHRVSRRAKNIVLELDPGRLVVNLGMTGRLLAVRSDEPLASHPGVRLALDDGRELRYHDIRRFGRLWRMDEETWREWEGRLGVEPLSDAFSAAWLREASSRSRVPIKTWLMDQRRVVGVGNIYASEALFRAGVDPRRPANRLTPDGVRRVRDAVREVLRESIDFRGTTFLDYRDARGERGEFAGRLRVYDRAGRPCAACGAPVERLVQAGRSTFFCPGCQS